MKTQLNRCDDTNRHFLQLFCETAPYSFSEVSKCMLQFETFFIYIFYFMEELHSNVCFLSCCPTG